MAFELVYTSASRGIRQGSSGFCVVACTKGMGAGLIAKLENLSAYKPVYPHYDPNAWENPVACSHCVVSGGGGSYHVLSRVCFNGLDYTKRSNKLASHIVLSDSEMSALVSGPAAPFFQPGLFRDASWEIKSELFERQADIAPSNLAPEKCSAWERFAGDAGWGGVLAEHFLASPQKCACILFDPLRHKNLIELVQESILLLPRDVRWNVCFNTYFTTLPAGVNCNWRFLPAGPEAERVVRRSPGALVIDLTRPLPAAEGGQLVLLARTGRVSVQASGTVSSPPEVKLPLPPEVKLPSPPEQVQEQEQEQERKPEREEESAVFPLRNVEDGFRPENAAARPGGTGAMSGAPPGWPPAGAASRAGSRHSAAVSNRGSWWKIALVLIVLMLFLGGGFFLMHHIVSSGKAQKEETELRREYAAYRERFRKLETQGTLDEETPLSADIEDLRERFEKIFASDPERETFCRDIVARSERFRKNLESLKQREAACAEAISELSNYQLLEGVEKFDRRCDLYCEATGVEIRTDGESGADVPVFRDELDRIRRIAENSRKRLSEAVNAFNASLQQLDEMQRKAAPVPENTPPSGAEEIVEPAPSGEESGSERPGRPDLPRIAPEFVWMHAAQLFELSAGNPVSFALAVDPGLELTGIYGPDVLSDGNTIRMTTDSGNELMLTASYRANCLTFEIRGGRLPEESQIYAQFGGRQSVYFYFVPGHSRLKFAGENALTAKWGDSGELHLKYCGALERVPDGDWKIALKSNGCVSDFVSLRSGSPEFVIPVATLDSFSGGKYLKLFEQVSNLTRTAGEIRKLVSEQLEPLAAKSGGEKFGFSTSEFKRLSREIELRQNKIQEQQSPLDNPQDKDAEARRGELRKKLETECDELKKKLEEERKNIVQSILARATPAQLRSMFGANRLFQSLAPKESVDIALMSAQRNLDGMRREILVRLNRSEIVLGDDFFPQITVEYIK